MQMIRSQYYFRDSDEGLLAWDVRRLVEMTRDFLVEEIPISEISELDEPHWYMHEGDTPTCRSLLEHMQLIDEADLRYPIILSEDGRVMDGMHRVCKAAREGRTTVLAVRFVADPAPDFVGRNPDELPYQR